MIQLETLGAVDLRRDGTEVRSVLLQPKRLALLAWLACARPHGFHSRDRLLALFWPESDEERARNALRQALHYLRRSLGEDAVPNRGERDVGIDPALLWCDAAAFDTALEEGRLADAVDLYRGDFLPGFFVEGAPEAERWVEDERERLRRAAVGACMRLAEREAAAGEVRSAAVRARRATAIDPSDEGAVRRLMEILERSGENAAALDAYTDFAARLETEYGLEPAEETRLLAERLRAPAPPFKATSPDPLTGASSTTATGPAPSAPAPVGGALDGAPPGGGAPEGQPPELAGPPAPDGGEAAATSAGCCACPPGQCSCHAAPAAQPAGAWTRMRRARAAAGVVALLTLLVGTGWWTRVRENRAPRDPTVAVLPFLNLSGDPGQEFFSDGITEELLNVLARTPGLRVAARTSSFAFKGKDVSVDSIGRALRVAHVLEGSVRRTGDELRVTAQLIDAATGYHVWSETYDRRLTDLFLVQDEISARIAELLRSTLMAGAPEVGERRPVDPDAHVLVLRAMQAARGGTVAQLRLADSLFTAALAIAPDHPPALTGAANARLWLGAFGQVPLADSYAEATRMAERALQLDPTSGEAHAVLARVADGRDQDFAAADRHFRRALELNPNDSRVLMWHAILLGRNGRHAEAVERARRSVDLDPLFVGSWANLGNVFAFGEAYDSAVAAYRTGLAMAPGDPLLGRNLASTLSEAGRHAEAVSAIDEVRRSAAPADFDMGLVVWIYNRAGRRAEAAALLDELEDAGTTGPMRLAVLYLQAGERERAVGLVERAIAEGDPNVDLLHRDPAWAALGDPRIDRILARLGK